MSRTLYFSVSPLNLLQKKPDDYGSHLTIGGYDTGYPTYSLESGRGDPGEPAWQDTFDYQRFVVVSASFAHPHNDAYEYYDTESGRTIYRVWHDMTVPDSFIIPDGIIAIGGNGYQGSSGVVYNNGSYSLDFYGALHDAAYHVVQYAAQQVQDKAIQNVAERLFPGAGSAIGNVISASTVLYGIQSDAASLLVDGISGNAGSASDYNQRVNNYLTSAEQRATDAAVGQLQLGSQNVNLLMDSIYSTYSITLDRYTPGSQVAGSITYGDHTYWATQYSTTSQAYIGTAGDDWHVGSTGADSIAGGPGNDTFAAGPGADRVYGGDGLDTVYLDGRRADYDVRGSGSGSAQLTGRNNFVGDNDSLVSVERLRFSDATVALDTSGHAGQAYRLYQAAFDRTPDTHGLSVNVGHLDRTLTLTQLASAFAASPEFTTRYGSQVSDTTFVTQLYQNVLHRAPDALGLTNWVNALSHAYSRGDVLAGFSESPENINLTAVAIQNGITLDLNF